MAALGDSPEDLCEESQRALSREGADETCPFCHVNAGWQKVEPAFLHVSEGARGPFVLAGGIPALSFACERCGFIRFHSTTILHRNRSKRRSK
jgi:hypothetical protein